MIDRTPDEATAVANAPGRQSNHPSVSNALSVHSACNRPGHANHYDGEILAWLQGAVGEPGSDDGRGAEPAAKHCPTNSPSAQDKAGSRHRADMGWQ
jgi:hypothetical protein